MKLIWFVPAVCLTLLFSCRNPVKISDQQPLRFDSEKYFLEQAEMLNNQKAAIFKKINKNNVAEEVHVDNPDWKKELQPFLQIKLNKPAQLNSFFVDTIINNQNTVVIYTAKDDTEELRRMSIYSTGGKPDSIIAIKSASNLYYKSADTISYLGNGNYRINTRNKPRIGKEISFTLEGIAQVNN